MRTTSPVRWSAALFLLRLTPGLVFLSEGIQKFLCPEALGAGRFAKLGFGHPAFWASFTGCFEIGCALLFLVGRKVRLAAVPLLVVMAVAFVTTKWPECMDKGFWTMPHDYRTDFAMTLSLIILLLLGAGNWSVKFPHHR